MTPDDSHERSHHDIPWILEADVERLLTMRPLVAAVREAFVHYAQGYAEIQPRRRAGVRQIPSEASNARLAATAPRRMLIHAMSAADGVWGLLAWKNYVTSRAGAKFVVALYSVDSLLPLAFFEADRLGQMRTGAASAVAIDRLTPPDLDAMGLFGAGWQAEGQIAGALAVRPIRRVEVYSRDDDRLRHFCLRMSSKHGIDVLPAGDPVDAAKGKRLVISATSSSSPIVRSDDLPREGLFIAMGSNWPEKQEFDRDFVRSCARIVVDHRESCLLEAGELMSPTKSFDWARTIELGDLLVPSPAATEASAASLAPPSGRILFKSVGIALEDLAAAKLVWEAFRATGDG